jgi:phage shock protein A
MNSREELLTSLEANRIVEAIHWQFEERKRLESKIDELEKQKSNLETGTFDLMLKIEELENQVKKLETKNSGQSQRIMALSTRIVEIQETQGMEIIRQ